MPAWCRLLLTGAGLLGLWQLLVWGSGVPAYILPPPGQVLMTWWQQAPLLAGHAVVTASEIVLGLLLGVAVGISSALLLVRFAPVRRWLLPLLVISQALPVFALAPVLMLWLGYGMGSKIAMAVLIIYFPVTASCYDGLRQASPGWLELARTMNARPLAILRYVQLPAALPALASGVRIAAATAPIGAVVGEWVGSSRGLGYLMLHANARMQIDLMFAALFTLALFALLLYGAVDRLMRRLVYW